MEMQKLNQFIESSKRAVAAAEARAREAEKLDCGVGAENSDGGGQDGGRELAILQQLCKHPNVYQAPDPALDQHYEWTLVAAAKAALSANASPQSVYNELQVLGELAPCKLINACMKAGLSGDIMNKDRWGYETTAKQPRFSTASWMGVARSALLITSRG